MRFIHSIIFIILLLSSNAVNAKGEFLFKRVKLIDAGSEVLLDIDRESKIIIQRMNQLLNIPENIFFVFGADDGPLYDSEMKEIWMPDDFTFEIFERFEQADYVKTEQELFNVTMDVIEHTLYHELGHALVDVLKIPVTGKEEDAVDSLATMLVILTNQDGGEIALSAADMFDLEGEDIKEFTDEDFWGEHSLDYQRFYNTVCHIYGSQPNRYQYLIEELEITGDRADLCIEDYSRMENSWRKLLHPYLKNKALLN